MSRLSVRLGHSAPVCRKVVVIMGEFEKHLAHVRKLAAKVGMEYPIWEIHLMVRCPQWDTCSADCPLDPLYLERGPADSYVEECTAQRPTRERIVAGAIAEGFKPHLKYGGRKRKEYNADNQSRRKKEWWAALSEKEKEERKAALARVRPGSRSRAVDTDKDSPKSGHRHAA